MKLSTKRLILRDLNKEDIGDIVENINNLNVSRYLAIVPFPYHVKDAKEWVNICKKESKSKKRKEHTFGIELKEDNKLIGAIGLHRINEFTRTAEVGYWAGQKYWRNGYCSEALGAILDFGFNRLKLRRIYAGVYTENKSSAKLLEKFGFKREGTRREHHKSKATGKIHDEYMYGLLKKEYK